MVPAGTVMYGIWCLQALYLGYPHVSGHVQWEILTFRDMYSGISLRTGSTKTGISLRTGSTKVGYPHVDREGWDILTVLTVLDTFLIS